MRRAKIVCTLGPSSCSTEMIGDLMEAGMNVARLNFSHGTHESHRQIFDLVRLTARARGLPIAVLADLQGPKIRVRRMADEGGINLERDTQVLLTAQDVKGTPGRIPHTYAPMHRDVAPGDRILLDDGRLELQVLASEGEDVRCRVVTGGSLTDRKGINLPGIALSTPCLTDKDKADLALALELGVGYVALSFVRRPEDIIEARLLAGDTPIIAKIEKPEAVENFAAILHEADGIMVARGDLGVEMGPERVPMIQKRLIEQTNARGKVVITATEMLDSMRLRPRPTRAEASDVANAILDGTDALMLSGETASGDYPLESVRTMDKIIREVELSPRYRSLPERASVGDMESTNAVARAAVVAARELGVRSILCFTESGRTAALVSEYRPEASILAVTSSRTVFRRLGLHWGVTPSSPMGSPPRTRRSPACWRPPIKLGWFSRARWW